MRQKVDTSLIQFLSGLQEAISRLDLLKGRKLRGIERVCGLDVSYSGSKAAAAAVTWSVTRKKVVEVANQTGSVVFPYIPGFLFMREAPLLVSVAKRLSIEPDLLLVDGHGLAHPRRAGLAVFVGLMLERPTLGLAKSLLVGNVGRFTNGFAPIIHNRRKIGFVVKPPQGRSYFASPGYAIRVLDIPATIRLIGTEYPVSLREAHRISKEALRPL